MISFPHPKWDISIVLFFNRFCGKSNFWDSLTLVFLSVDAIRTAVLVALMAGLWQYGKIKNDMSANKKVLQILFSIILCLGIIEIANAVIESQRPIVTYKSLINSPLLNEDTKELWKDGWVRNPKHGSFPSDTVALLATIAIGLYSWNKLLGFFALIFVFLMGILPRLYFGLHYPSDLMIGFGIALFSVIITGKIRFLEKVYLKILEFEKRFPYLFGVAGFYLFYIIADKFILLRKLPVWLKAMLSGS